MSKISELELVSQLLAKQTDISLAIIFGSIAKGSASAKSDIDIAVKTSTKLTTERKLSLIEMIAKLLGRPVDLIDLNSVGEPLLGQILKYGTLVKGSRTELAQLAIKHVYAEADFVPYLQRSMQERRNAWIK